jgi:hypothetical protein
MVVPVLGLERKRAPLHHSLLISMSSIHIHDSLPRVPVRVSG